MNLIKIQSFNLSHYNYSLLTNNVPLIRALLLEVDPPESIAEFYGRDLCITIKSKPEIFLPYQKYISLNADGKCDVSDIEPEMRPYTLETITEIQKCVINISIRDRSEVFGSLSYTIDLQPYNCWGGFSRMPEYLCSLVTPSQPEVEKIVSAAYENLRRQGELPINDGYQDKSIQKVYAVVRAVYDAIRSIKITYNITKTDYLSKSVLLQPCEILLEHMIGSSLDIALLFSSCLENLGLNPVIAVFRNHVLLGCFLKDLRFCAPVTENFGEMLALTKAPGEMLFMFEPTSIANGMSIDFENACRSAKDYCDKNSGMFTAVVDVKAARACGIKSLPNRLRKNGVTTFEKNQRAFDDFFGDWVDINDESVDAADRELAKLKNEIFDFSENNPFINADLKNTVILACDSMDGMPSKLSETFNIIPCPDGLKPEAMSPEQCCAALDKIPGIISDNPAEITALCRETSLKKRLDHMKSLESCDLYYSYHTYIALYYAKWKSPDTYGTIYTPMFFYPCELTFDNDGYKLRIISRRAVLNPVFIEKLKKLFTVNFAALSKIPSHEILNRRDYIFSVISSAFNGKNKIKFIPCASLGAYEFASFEDYAHLNRHSVSHSVAKAVLMGTPVAETAARAPELDNDSIFPLNTPSPLEPDHRQKKALYDSLENSVSFISGGVNSGKTRVAADIVFNMLSKSKNVLYVGGTKSACDDMKKYLEYLHLDKYALFLTPYAPELAGAFEPEKPTDKRPAELYVKAQRLMQKRSEIWGYYKALHKKQKTGFDLYQTVMQYEKYKNAKFCVSFTPGYIKELDDDKVIASFRQISELIKASKECGLPYRHPLSKIGRKDFSYEMKSGAVKMINSYKAALESFLDCQDELCELMYIDLELLREDQTNSLEKLMSLLSSKIEFLPSALFSDDCHRTLNRLNTVIDNAEKRLNSSEQIFALFEVHVLDLDANEMLNEYKSSLSAFFVKRNGIQKKLLATLRNHLLEGKTLTPDNLSEVLYSLLHYTEYNNAVAADAADFKELFGIDMFSQDFESEKQSLERLKQIYSVCEEYVLQMDNICRRECDTNQLLPKQSVLICDYLQNPEGFNRKFDEFRKLRAAFTESENALVKYLSIDIYSLKDKMALRWYEYLYAWITELEQAIDGLKSWCEYLSVRENALALHLESAVSLFETTQMTHDEFRQAFLKGFFKASCEYILSNEHVFSVFSQESCDTACSDIKELTEQLDNLMIEDLEIRLSADYRDYSNHNISDGDDKAYLDSKDLSELFASNRKLLQKRFPVTVSQGGAINSYISEDTLFDCIVIDDIHAVPYYSLLGLFNHTEKVIMLGMDTANDKALFSEPEICSYAGRGACFKPASLYSRMIKTGLPIYTLPYKYGTRRDLSLLVGEVFSKHAEQSYPYPSGSFKKINIIHTNGVFERRGSPVNFTEASCVVDELKATDPQTRTAVCAFTRAQAALIRQMWQQTSGQMYDMNIYALEDYPSAVFDKVIISTVFSTNNNSEMLPFVPTQLASDNYRLRLNYLLSGVSGALTLCTCLDAGSLDAIEPYTESLYAFKRFIKFIFDRTTYSAAERANEFDKNFIKIEICEFLQKLGYETVRNVGSPEVKIDVAVRKKGASDAFVLGILLDNYCSEQGDVYTSEILMPRLMKADGWKIVRIFTNEWYENYNKQLEKISELMEIKK